MFVYKQTKTIEYVEKWLTFSKKQTLQELFVPEQIGAV